MTPDLLKWAASLGVGGILAAGMFWVYRHDAREAQGRLEAMQQNTVIRAEPAPRSRGALLAAHRASSNLGPHRRRREGPAEGLAGTGIGYFSFG